MSKQATTGTEANHYAMIPNSIYELGLSTHAICLYGAIKRSCGEDPAGYCDRSTSTLARMCSCSTGKISTAKKELARPIPQLGNKPLIQVQKRKGHNTDFITITSIWKENRAICDRAQRSHYESQRSQYETRKNLCKKTPYTPLTKALSVSDLEKIGYTPEEAGCIDLFHQMLIPLGYRPVNQYSNEVRQALRKKVSSEDFDSNPDLDSAKALFQEMMQDGPPKKGYATLVRALHDYGPL